MRLLANTPTVIAQLATDQMAAHVTNAAVAVVVVVPASPVVNRHKASHHAVTVAPKAALATLPGGHPKVIAMAPVMVVVRVNRIPCAPALMP